MSKKAWERIGIAAMAVIVFICALIAIRWSVNLVAWSAIDSGWAAAIGTFVAIVGTWYTTRFQLMHAERIRHANKLGEDVVIAEIAYELANDAHRTVFSIEEKYMRFIVGLPHRHIGRASIEDLQESLRSFAAQALPALLYKEILTLKREAAFTLTSIERHNIGTLANFARLEKARRRTEVVIASKVRISALLDAALVAAGKQARAGFDARQIH